jgi:hypothetical protein
MQKTDMQTNVSRTLVCWSAHDTTATIKTKQSAMQDLAISNLYGPWEGSDCRWCEDQVGWQ